MKQNHLQKYISLQVPDKKAASESKSKPKSNETIPSKPAEKDDIEDTDSSKEILPSPPKSPRSYSLSPTRSHKIKLASPRTRSEPRPVVKPAASVMRQDSESPPATKEDIKLRVRKELNKRFPRRTLEVGGGTTRWNSPPGRRRMPSEVVFIVVLN